ncbi:MAG TPA: hypothetical protein VJU87_07145 [Gemmatimonadaceae bacterium]|nr:hypothetical protein [Gemmatimonadaceae bacterium]
MRDLTYAPVAGMPWHYAVSDGIEIETPDLEAWGGSPVSAGAVSVRHVRGSADVVGARPVMSMPPWSTYYMDPDGGLQVLFHPIAERGQGPQLLSTVRDGHEYEVRYEGSTTGPVRQRDKELALITMVLGARRSGFLVHACGFVAPVGRAVLCPAPSGTGKSTLARLLLRAAPEVQLLNDDRVIVTLANGHLHAWGSPWPGQGGIACAADAPVGVLCFIARTETPRVRRVTPREALGRLWKTVALPLWSAAETDAALAIMEALVTRIPVVEVAYPVTESAGRWILDVVGDLTSD